MEDPLVLELFSTELTELRNGFELWEPKEAKMKDLRRKVRLLERLKRTQRLIRLHYSARTSPTASEQANRPILVCRGSIPDGQSFTIRPPSHAKPQALRSDPPLLFSNLLLCSFCASHLLPFYLHSSSSLGYMSPNETFT